MYICESCGKIHKELPTYEEDFGYDVGVGYLSAKQTLVDYCDCGGNIVEGTECEECGEVFEKNGEQTICDKCLEKYKTFDNAIKIGANYPVKVAVNQFLLECFSISQIEEILARELAEAKKLGNTFTREVERYLGDNEWLSGNVEGL